MSAPSDNATWIIEAGDEVIQKKARDGVGSLSPVEGLIYCLWVADYGMTNAGDLETAHDLYADFQTEGARLAKALACKGRTRRLPCQRQIFSGNILNGLTRFAMKSETPESSSTNTDAMRKLTAIGVIVFVLAVVAFLCRQHSKHSRDERIYRNLPGTWTMSFGSLTVHPDGSYVFQFTVSPTIGLVTNEGTFRVGDGFLIATVTESYRKNAAVPHVTPTRIAMANDREMLIDTGAKNKLGLQKDAI